jgi:hypothetical protein
LAFVVAAVAWSIPVWLGLAQERRLYEDRAALESEGMQAVAVMVLCAVANGHDAIPTIRNDLEPVASVEPVLDRLERAGLVAGEWTERPGHVTTRRYRLTRQAIDS